MPDPKLTTDDPPPDFDPAQLQSVVAAGDDRKKQEAQYWDEQLKRSSRPDKVPGNFNRPWWANLKGADTPGDPNAIDYTAIDPNAPPTATNLVTGEAGGPPQTIAQSQRPVKKQPEPIAPDVAVTPEERELYAASRPPPTTARPPQHATPANPVDARWAAAGAPGSAPDWLRQIAGDYNEQLAGMQAESEARTPSQKYYQAPSTMAGVQEPPVALTSPEDSARQALRAQQDVDARQHAREQARIDVGAERHRMEIETLINDWKNGKVDENKVFRDMNFVQKAMLVVGAGLLGYGGHAQTAIDNINQMIDRSIKVQQNELDRKKQGIGLAINAYDTFLGTSRNALEASDKTRALQEGILQSAFEDAAAKQREGVTRAQLAQAAGALKLQRDMTLARLTAMPSGAAGAAGSSGATPNDILIPINEGSLIVNTPDGRQAYVGDAKVGAALNDMIGRTMTADALVEKVRQLDATRSAHFPGTSESYELKNARENLAELIAAQHGVAKGIGVIRAEQEATGGGTATYRGIKDQGLLSDLAGVAVPGRLGPALDQAKRTMHTLVDEAMRAHNLQFGQQSGIVNGKGGSHIRFTLTGQRMNNANRPPEKPAIDFRPGP